LFTEKGDVAFLRASSCIEYLYEKSLVLEWNNSKISTLYLSMEWSSSFFPGLSFNNLQYHSIDIIQKYSIDIYIYKYIFQTDKLCNKSLVTWQPICWICNGKM